MSVTFSGAFVFMAALTAHSGYYPIKPTIALNSGIANGVWGTVFTGSSHPGVGAALAFAGAAAPFFSALGTIGVLIRPLRAGLSIQIAASSSSHSLRASSPSSIPTLSINPKPTPSLLGVHHTSCCSGLNLFLAVVAFWALAGSVGTIKYVSGRSAWRGSEAPVVTPTSMRSGSHHASGSLGESGRRAMPPSWPTPPRRPPPGGNSSFDKDAIKRGSRGGGSGQRRPGRAYDGPPPPPPPPGAGTGGGLASDKNPDKFVDFQMLGMMAVLGALLGWLSNKIEGTFCSSKIPSGAKRQQFEGLGVGSLPSEKSGDQVIALSQPLSTPTSSSSSSSIEEPTKWPMLPAGSVSQARVWRGRSLSSARIRRDSSRLLTGLDFVSFTALCVLFKFPFNSTRLRVYYYRPTGGNPRNLLIRPEEQDGSDNYPPTVIIDPVGVDPGPIPQRIYGLAESHSYSYSDDPSAQGTLLRPTTTTSSRQQQRHAVTSPNETNTSTGTSPRSVPPPEAEVILSSLPQSPLPYYNPAGTGTSTTPPPNRPRSRTRRWDRGVRLSNVEQVKYFFRDEIIGFENGPPVSGRVKPIATTTTTTTRTDSVS